VPRIGWPRNGNVSWIACSEVATGMRPARPSIPPSRRATPAMQRNGRAIWASVPVT
jgi:hypothetical protein